jgi:hypothetical protein
MNFGSSLDIIQYDWFDPEIPLPGVTGCSIRDSYESEKYQVYDSWDNFNRFNNPELSAHHRRQRLSVGSCDLSAWRAGEPAGMVVRTW